MKKYSGFTLIEMLIVMGIIIILMAVGIAGGRFAIQRAHRIQKRSAVDNIEQALWGYYTDFRQFPTDSAGGAITPRMLIEGSSAILVNYLDAGSWDGGSDGTYWYFYGSGGQDFIVCGSLGGFNDDLEVGIYCTGNALTSGTIFTNTTTASDNIYEPAPVTGHEVYAEIKTLTIHSSGWYGETRSWDSP